MTFWAHSTQSRPWPFFAGQNNAFKTSGDNEWVLLNLGVTGYYQVNYDEGNWRKIQNQLQSDLTVGIPPALPPWDDGSSDRRDCPFLEAQGHTVSLSRLSLPSIVHRLSTTPSTWPGECPPG